MAFIRITSPHVHGSNKTAAIMQWVLLCTLPGFFSLLWFFGWGVLINVVFASLLAVLGEAAVLKLRGRPVGFYIKDYSAVVTAVLLALALPPFAPWWVTTVAVLFSIIIAKQLYGGLGSNPFNPAMAGYALVLVSFPVAMTTHWSAPSPLHDGPGFLTTLEYIFMGSDVGIDAYTMATPLDIYKHQIAISTVEEVIADPVFGTFASLGWEWVNLGFLLGGLILIWRKIISWHIPLSMLAGLSLSSLIFGWDEDLYTPLHIHLLSGATMLGAFFIATDPVTAATSRLGKLYYGAGTGIILYIIRTWGSYPDAVAFAVLLMNFAAPFIDYYTRPRSYGHTSAQRGIRKVDSA
jgi:Na+-translocating ferredoxin:NAD+ oxidoreductase subunit D